MIKPNVLIIIDKRDVEYIDTRRQSERWNIFWKIINYEKLHREVGELSNLIAQHDIDFILYSRNDQVAGRIDIGSITRRLRTGYSSFSGIDERDRVLQMKESFNDFIEGNRELDFHVEEGETVGETQDQGTFSIVFDTEQVGEIRYGLPRILSLLNKYGVKAVFFLTNFVKSIYPNLLDRIRSYGHEVGLHGMWHEYLSGHDEEKQRDSIRVMSESFSGEIKGANFVGRMDLNTIRALISNRVRYFVYPAINYYRFWGYPKLPAIPSLVRLHEGAIWAMPISAETYGYPWLSIKNMVDSALVKSRRHGFQHLTILCHPFRDGNLAHLKNTERLLRYLMGKELKPITLGEMTGKLSRDMTNSVGIGEAERLLEQKKRLCFFPQTRQDYSGLIPENFIKACRAIRGHHAIF